MIEEEPSQTFKVLLILSEILIPLIIFIGVYFIFKPVFGKEEKKKESTEGDGKPKEEG